MKKLNRAEPERKDFIGVWVGVSCQEGTLVTQRDKDGKYATFLISVKNNEVQRQYIEGGSWWIRSGRFYEQRWAQDEPDVYNYTIDKDSICFKLISGPAFCNNPGYEFRDVRSSSETFF